MAGLLTIAAELIDHCLSFVAKEDLIALSISCKCIRNRCQPLIYRDINLVWTRVNTRITGPHMHLLLRSYAENPSLSTHTITVGLHAIGFRDRNANRSPIVGRAPNSADLETISRIVRESRVPRPGSWIEAVAAGRLDAMITLFIIRLIKLKRLCIGLDLLYRDSFLSAGLKHVLESAPGASLSCWEHLEHVSLGMDLVPDQYSHRTMLSDINQYTPFFYLPKLSNAELLIPDTREQPSHTRRTLTMWSNSEKWAWPICNRPHAEQLTCLRLRYTRASPSMLDHILRATPNLSALEYTNRCRVWEATPFDCDQVGRALSHVRTTLCSLTAGLIFFGGSAGDYGDFGFECICGSLQGAIKDFPKLASLEIAPIVLYGWEGPAAELADILPSSLEKLSLRDDMGEFGWMRWTEEACLRVLENFLSSGIWRSTTPALKEVNLHALESETYEWQPLQRAAFRDVVQSQGLRCSVIKPWPKDPPTQSDATD